MVQSTPSPPAGAQHEHDPKRAATRPLAEGLPYIAVALANSVVFYLMFKPWMSATGWDGIGFVNAFGRMRRTTRHLNLWSQTPPPGPIIGNTWAVLASVAIVITVVAALWASRYRNGVAETVTAVAAVATAIFVAMDLYYLNAAIPKVQLALSMSKDLTAQIGLAIGALRGSSSYPWPGEESQLRVAGLTTTALISLAIAVVTAGIAAVRARHSLRPLIKAVASRIL